MVRRVRAKIIVPALMFRQSGILPIRPPLLARCFKAQRPPNYSRLSVRFQLRHAACPRPQCRPLSSSSTPFNEQKPSKPPTPTTPKPGKPPYIGPLALTFQRLKIFSISSFSASCALAPFMFIVESNLPMSARVSLASIAVGTSGISTALVGWCGQPYVITLRYLTPEESGGAEGIEMTTQTLLLRQRVTRVRLLKPSLHVLVC